MSARHASDAGPSRSRLSASGPHPSPAHGGAGTVLPGRGLRAAGLSGVPAGAGAARVPPPA
eukprot:2824969-Pleurochrysis_carterae.AAC.1